MTTTPNSYFGKISTLVKSQLPMRVRDSYPVFTEFLEAYYEYLEVDKPVLQEGRVIQRAKNLNSYRDVDTTLDDFAELLFREFLALIPHDSQVDKRMLLKHVKDFYRSRGTEKSYRFLLRILSNEENPGDLPVDFYYPKLDILRASDGKWYIQKALRLFNLQHDNEPISEQDINLFLEFAGEQIRGASSNAAAIVDKAEHFFEQGVLIDEVTLSSIRGTFEGGEIVSTSYQDDDGVSHTLTATVLDGIVNRIILGYGGTGYSVGDAVIFDPTSGGSGAEAIVDAVTSGGIANVTVISGGAGFKVGNPLLFTGSSGSGANGSVVTVDTSGFVHPNTYTIESSTISLEANTQVGNTVYSNLNSANANSTISNAINTFIFANTGPVLAITMAQQGNNYLTLPNIDVVANTRVKALGILGKLVINDGGTGYAVSDELVFTNVIGGHGVGARANVTAIDGDGTITAVRFQQMGGHIIGGTGYDNNFLPTVTVATAGGSGANITVATILGDGENLQAGVTSIGTILSFLIISGGSGYNTAPTVNLTQSGDGTARANATVLSGVFSYPGRYLNDDGHLSSFNFLQDAHYYQNYSYVLRVKNSLVNYKKAVKDILHPAGMKLFGEFLYVANTINLPLITTSNVEHDIEEVYCTEAAQFDGSANSLVTVLDTNSYWGPFAAENESLLIDFIADAVVIKDANTPLNTGKSNLNTKLIYSNPSAKYVMNQQGILVLGTSLRCEYTTTGQALGLRVEEERTNYLLNSRFENGIAGSPGTIPTNWTSSITTGSISYSNTSRAQGQTRIGFISTAGNRNFLFQNVAVAASTTYYYSTEIDVVTGAEQFQNYFTITGAPGGSTLEYFANGASVAATTTISAGRQLLDIRLNVGGTPGFVLLRSGGGTSSNLVQNTEVYFDLTQFEIGSFKTSYIPTSANVTATRLSDNIYLFANAMPSLMNSATIAAEYRFYGANVAGVFAYNDNSANNSINYRANLRTALITSNAVNSVNTALGAGALGLTHKIAIAAEANNFAGSINGGTEVTDNTVTMPIAATHFRIGSIANNNNHLNGHISQILALPRRVSNSNLVTLSSNTVTWQANTPYTISMWLNFSTLPSVNNSFLLLSRNFAATLSNSYLIAKNTADANSATGVHIEYIGIANTLSTQYMIKSRSDMLPLYTNTFYHVMATIDQANVANSRILIDGIDSTVVTIEANSTPSFSGFNGYMTEFVFSNTNIAVANLSANSMPANVIANIPASSRIAYYKGNTTTPAVINASNYRVIVSNSIAVTTNTTPSNI